MFRIEKGFLVEIYVQKLKMKTFGTQFLENWYLKYGSNHASMSADFDVNLLRADVNLIW